MKDNVVLEHLREEVSRLDLDDTELVSVILTRLQPGAATPLAVIDAALAGATDVPPDVRESRTEALDVRDQLDALTARLEQARTDERNVQTHSARRLLRLALSPRSRR